MYRDSQKQQQTFTGYTDKTNLTQNMPQNYEHQNQQLLQSTLVKQKPVHYIGDGWSYKKKQNKNFQQQHHHHPLQTFNQFSEKLQHFKMRKAGKNSSSFFSPNDFSHQNLKSQPQDNGAIYATNQTYFQQYKNPFTPVKLSRRKQLSASSSRIFRGGNYTENNMQNFRTPDSTLHSSNSKYFRNRNNSIGNCQESTSTLLLNQDVVVDNCNQTLDLNKVLNDRRHANNRQMRSKSASSVQQPTYNIIIPQEQTTNPDQSSCIISQKNQQKVKLLQITIQHLKQDLLQKVGTIASQSKDLQQLRAQVSDLRKQNRQLRSLKYKRMFFGGGGGACSSSIAMQRRSVSSEHPHHHLLNNKSIDQQQELSESANNNNNSNSQSKIQNTSFNSRNKNIEFKPSFSSQSLMKKKKKKAELNNKSVNNQSCNFQNQYTTCSNQQKEEEEDTQNCFRRKDSIDSRSYRSISAVTNSNLTRVDSKANFLHPVTGRTQAAITTARLFLPYNSKKQQNDSKHNITITINNQELKEEQCSFGVERNSNLFKKKYEDSSKSSFDKNYCSRSQEFNGVVVKTVNSYNKENNHSQHYRNDSQGGKLFGRLSAVSGRDSTSSTFRKSSRKFIQQPLCQMEKSAQSFLQYLNKIKSEFMHSCKQQQERVKQVSKRAYDSGKLSNSAETQQNDKQDRAEQNVQSQPKGKKSLGYQSLQLQLQHQHHHHHQYQIDQTLSLGQSDENEINAEGKKLINQAAMRVNAQNRLPPQDQTGLFAVLLADNE